MRRVIAVLANSIKHGKHCVAGKDVETKEWIRLVSNIDGAELDKDSCLCRNPYGRFPVKPLQKVDIEISSHRPLPHQPDNYLIGDGEWLQRYTVKEHELPMYMDTPESVWGEGSRIPYRLIEMGQISISQSLYLIKAEALTLHVTDKHKRRAIFTYNGYSYDLPVTDPSFDKHLEHGNHGNIICVSLGEKYAHENSKEFWCYKIIATII